MTHPSPTAPMVFAAVLRHVSRHCGRFGAAVGHRVLEGTPAWLAPTQGVISWAGGSVGTSYDLSDGLQRDLFFTGVYAPALLYQVRREVRKVDVVVDVGANIGAFAVPIGSCLDGQAGLGDITVSDLSATVRLPYFEFDAVCLYFHISRELLHLDLHYSFPPLSYDLPGLCVRTAAHVNVSCAETPFTRD